MANRFLSNIKINDSYTLPSADGTNGQIISTDGSGNLSFIDNTGDNTRSIVFTVKNISGGNLTKGTVVHASPSATPPSGNVIEVIKADNDVSGSMPAIGVLNETLADDAEGDCVMMGSVSGIDTSSFSVGDELYVDSSPGAFTATKPTGTSNLIQKIGIVIKSHASNGKIEVFGAGKTNDVPNLVNRTINFADNAQLRIGDGSDLRIYHDGSNSIIDNNTNDLIIRCDSDDIKILAQDDIVLRDNDDSTNFIHCINGGSVKLYHNGSEKLETTSSGIDVTGDGVFSGDVTINGSHLTLANGTTSAQSTDYLYIGGSNLASADAAIYIGNQGAGGGYGYRIYYSGVGTGNNNKLILKSENLGTEVDMLTFTADGNATFSGTIKQTGKTLTIEANDPEIVLKDTDEGTDDKVFRIINVSEELRFTARTDSNGANADGGDVLKITRSGNSTFAGAIQAADGSAGNPSITFSGDTDTGIYRTSSNAINFGTNGSERMRINNTGLGIGTSSPSAKLHVNGVVTANDSIQVQNDDSGFICRNAAGTVIGTIGAESSSTPNIGMFTVRNNGNNRILLNANGSSYFNGGAVGIGTTAPFSDLSINVGANAPSSSGNMASEGLTVHNASGGRAIQIGVNESGAYNYIQSSYVNNSNVAVNLAFFTGASERMRITSGGKVGIGLTNPNSFYADQLVVNEGMTLYSTGNSFLCFADGTSGDDRRRGEVRYEHSSNSMVFMTNAVNRMTIDSSGNVGIGTTSPSDALEVYGATKGIIINNTAETDAGILFRDSADPGQQASIKYGSGDNLLKFLNSTSVRMVINTSGNVGIGTTSPDHILCIEDSEPTLRIFDTNNTLNQEQTIAFGTEPGNRTQAEIAGINLNTGNAEGGLVFKTNSGSSLSERMRITSAGNVGIGTSSPSHNLHIVSSGNGEIKAERTSGAAMLIQSQSALGRFGTTTNHNLQFFTNNAGRVTINTSGNVGIGTTSPVAKLHINGTGDLIRATSTNSGAGGAQIDLLHFTTSPADGDINGMINFGGYYTGTTSSYATSIRSVWYDVSAQKGDIQFFARDGGSFVERMKLQHTGNLHVDGDVVAYSTSVSDVRLKDNVKPLKNSLNKIINLKGVEYIWNNGSRKGQKDIGFIAQEVENIIPEIVRENEVLFDKNTKYKTVDYEKITAVLVEAVKELQQEIETLKKQINK